jgi:NAD(P)-dependent dehydrogenase (short-subunit alcohol dehydrogenase family)
MTTEGPQSMFALDGKVALVTGASSGIGAHFARTLARAGARVVLAARRLEALEALAAEIRDEGGAAFAVRMDVTDEASVEAAFEAATAAAGLPDVLVNNSGVSGTGSLAHMMPAEVWDEVFATNARGVWLCARAGARRLVEAGRPGAIVNVASIRAHLGFKNFAAYGASKAAIVNLTQNMALELARFRIRVNALAPGYFDTPLNDGLFDTRYGREMIERIPQRRLGELSELDGALLLLASEAGSYITGSTIVVDGGHSHASV